MHINYGFSPVFLILAFFLTLVEKRKTPKEIKYHFDYSMNKEIEAIFDYFCHPHAYDYFRKNK